MDAFEKSVQSYLQQSLIIFPKCDIMESADEQECPVITINRSVTQFYFIKRLHERFHGDLGPNGLNELVEYFEN